MPLYDFECPACGHHFEDIAKLDDKDTVTCPLCTEGWVAKGNHRIGATKTFTTIIATTPHSKKYKAGYVHSHGDRPKTEGKIQVGYTGTSKR